MSNKEVNQVDTSPEEIKRDLNEAINRHEIEPEAPQDAQQTEKAPEPAPPSIPFADLLFTPLRGTFDILCPAWALSDDEIHMLCGVYGDALDYYFPGMNLGPGASAALVTAAIFSPRIGQPRKVKELDATKESEENEAA